MKKQILSLFVLLLATPVFAGDFITQFLNKCVEEKRPVNNVNIGKTMLNKIIAHTGDESLKTAFHDLSNIRIVTTENKKDSQHYFKKANELANSEFGDFQEVVSLNEKKNKMTILIRKSGEKDQDIILISLDDNRSLTIITITGKIDLSELPRLSTTLEGHNIEAEDDRIKEDPEDS